MTADETITKLLDFVYSHTHTHTHTHTHICTVQEIDLELVINAFRDESDYFGVIGSSGDLVGEFWAQVFHRANLLSVSIIGKKVASKMVLVGGGCDENSYAHCN